ncbi:MAG: hypothetical protein V3T22_01435, partial [Planctomycetota bacterium]
RPGGRMRGELDVPGSKSIAQRALIAAAFAPGPTRITGLPAGADVVCLLDALGGLGVAVARLGPRTVLVDGRAPGQAHENGASHATRALDVGESGTAARLLTAAVALCAPRGALLEVQGSGSLARRSSPALFAALRSAGARLDPRDAGGAAGTWPVRITPVSAPELLVLEDPASSQEVTALLLALAAWPGERQLKVEGQIPSRTYVQLTRSVLADFGVAVEHSERSGGTDFHLQGPLVAPPEAFRVEPDASSAAVALAAACLSGGELRVRGLTRASRQGDVSVVDHLSAFGCSAGEERGALWARGRPTRGAQIDLARTPDLAPVLAAVAGAVALADLGTSHLLGLETLPGKESSRIEVLAGALQALGLQVRATARDLTIAPGKPTQAALTLDPKGDHRMAFAFGLLGLVREGLAVRDAGCVAKSWPGFWDDLQRAGAARLA